MTGVDPGDIVKVYTSEHAQTAQTSVAVPAGRSDISLSLPLDPGAGSFI
ncbi:hypothetical protein LJK88_06130 [Paenibacillus sp. P26]|nr:hypothetical protein LJK88_06130 [Paenibacillus sp. P26]